jgi:competence CoiA-like predicted nuclease
MSLTAKTLSGIDVFAPELTEKRQGFTCRFCGQPMVFVDAHLKIKHFRHKTESLCDSEPETEEHEHYKWLVYKMLKNKKIGGVFAEHRIGNVIADIYMDREEWPNIAFEIQTTNYSPLKYEEKINIYAFRRLLVVYIFVGNDFNNEIKPNIYSLKEIEKRIFNEKIYCDTVIGCYLKDENIIIPSFKQKYAKGQSGYCTNRFIINYTKIR